MHGRKYASLRPSPRHRRLALRAPVARDQVLLDLESPALDQQYLAIGTVGILASDAGHIADVHELQACLEGNVLGTGERLEWGGRQAGELVLRMEPAEMQRVISKSFFDQPVAHFRDLIEIVGPVGYDQVGDLQPDSLVPECFKRCQHRIKLARREL